MRIRKPKRYFSRRNFSKSIHAAAIEACEQRLLMSTYTVNTTSDTTNVVAGVLTLRQAVAEANASEGPDTIQFDPSVFSAGSLHTITLTQGPISFTDEAGTATVQGPGQNVLAISGNQQSRVFNIKQYTSVLLLALTVTDGAETTADSSGDTYGGGIYNAGTLMVDESNVSGNSVHAGEMQSANSDPVGNGYGGGIYSTGTLSLQYSTLSDNTVTNTGKSTDDTDPANTGEAEGGAVYSAGALEIGAVNITDNTLQGLSAASSGYDSGPAIGAGIYAGSTVSIVASNITGNTATGGDTVLNSYGAGFAGDASGGGLYAAGDATIISSSIINNSASGGGGGLDSGRSGAVHGGGIAAAASLTISSSNVSHNSAKVTGGNNTLFSAGGGIFAAGDASLTSDTIANNSLEGGPPFNAALTAAAGGGVYVGGTATLQQSSISGNSVTVQQSAFYQPGGKAAGGGLYAMGGASISESTISGNSVTGGHGYTQATDYNPEPGGSVYGGGVYTAGAMTITNSTIVANAAAGGVGGSARNQSAKNGGSAIGGGIYGLASLVVADATITGNTTTGGPGGVTTGGMPYLNGNTGPAGAAGLDGQTSSTIITNTIIAGDKAAGAYNDVNGLNAGSDHNNFVGAGSHFTNGVNGNIVGVNNPQLSALGYDGGTTEVMLPLAGSPVINAGNNSYIPTGVTTDQRGSARIIGSSVDIGAVEYTAPVTGSVFNDLNGDGIREAGENGIAGVSVYADLSNSGAFQAGDPAAITNSSGNYVLNGLPAGAVIIRQLSPNGYRQSAPIGGAGQHVTVGSAAVTTAVFEDSAKLYVSGSVTLNGMGVGGVLIYADLNNDGKFESNENNKLTASDGSFAFQSLSAGTYTFRIVTPGADVQLSPAANSGIVVTLSSGGQYTAVNFTLAPQPARLTGTVIGTSGSYNNQGNSAAKAFDGNLSTFFDAPTASGGYAGLNFGAPVLINQISFAPRSGFASRMVGGVFQASNTPDFSGQVVTLYTVTSTPATGVLTTVSVYDPSACQYVRYVGPTNGYCNIAEAQFYGMSPTGVSLQPNGALVIIATPGSDTIDVNYSDGGSGSLYSITATLNGVQQSFSNVPLQSIAINAGDGNNKVSIEGIDDNTSSTLVSITTGSGNDAISTGISTAFAGVGITLVINTGDGTDSVDAIYDGQATITGGSGADSLTAEAAENLPAYATIYGGDGNDTIAAGAGGNTFVTAYGQGGDDTFAIDDYQDTLAASGGAGVNAFDMTDYDTAESAKVIALDGLTHGNLTLGTDIQNINADFDGNLTINANSTSNDTIQVTDPEGDGQVTVVGGAGSDTTSIKGDAEVAINAAGSGAENIKVLGASEVTVNGGNGGDYIDVASGSSDATNNDPLSVSINGGNGNDTIYGFAEHATVNGGAGNDTINFGGSSELYLYGGDGNDTLTGEGGILVIDGGAGNDVIHTVPIEADQYTYVSASITGGAGNDTIYAADGDVTTVNGGGGIDTAYVDPFDVVSNVQYIHYGNPVKLSGNAIGTSGSYRNHGTALSNAVDGNLATFFDGPDASGDWVGLDLGSAKVANQVEYAPRAGYESRMVGGEIQASNTANFSSGVVTLYTITSSPAAGVLTSQDLNNTSAFRYYRYIGPTNSYCDIAELSFFG